MFFSGKAATASAKTRQKLHKYLQWMKDVGETLHLQEQAAADAPQQVWIRPSIPRRAPSRAP